MRSLCPRRFLCYTDEAHKNKADDDLVLVLDTLPDSTTVDYGDLNHPLKVVRAKATAMIRFKPINGNTQCEVTAVQHFDTNGLVPERYAVAKIPKALAYVRDMRELFQRDDAVDSEMIRELMDNIKYVRTKRATQPN